MPTSKLTVKIDTKACIGAASCVATSPKLFNLDEDNVAFLVDPATGEEKSTLTLEVSDAEKALIQEAADNCPTSAITISA
jgi:ferredoxin